MTYLLYNDAIHTNWTTMGQFMRHMGRGAWRSYPFHTDLKKADPSKWMYRSLYSYDMQNLQTYCNEQIDAGNILKGGTKPSLAGYAKRFPKEEVDAICLVIDIDAVVPMIAQAQAEAICTYLESIGSTYYVWYSGSKGFHVEIPRTEVGYTRDPDLPAIHLRLVRRLVNAVFEETGTRIKWDSSIYERSKKYRMPNCPRTDGRHKILLSLKALRACDPDQLARLSRQVRPLPSYAFGKADWSAANPVLRDMWVEARDHLPPVTEHRKTNIERGWENLSDLEMAIRDLPSSQTLRIDGDMAIKHDCQHPAGHSAGTRLSAIYFPSSGIVFCHGASCPRIHSAPLVASYMGIQLEAEALTERPKGLEEGRLDLAMLFDRILGDEGERNQNYMIKSPVGSGKSYSLRRAAENHGRQMLYMVDTHDLGHEVWMDLSGAMQLGSFYDVEPRCFEQMIDPSESVQEGDSPTSRVEEILARYELEMAKSSVCHSCPLYPDHSGTTASGQPPCQWWQEFRLAQTTMEVEVGTSMGQSTINGDFIEEVEVLEIMGNLVATKAYLQYPSVLAKLSEGRDLIVIDEDCLDHICSISTYAVSDLMEEQFNPRPIKLHDGTVSTVGAVIQMAIDEQIVAGREANYGSLVSDHSNQLIGADITDYVDEDGFLGLHKLGTNEVVTAFFHRLARGTVTSLRKISQKGADYISVRCQSDLRVVSDDTQWILLDATAAAFDIEVMGRVIPGGIQFEEVVIQNPDATIIHDPSCSYSLSGGQRAIKDLAEGGTGFNRYNATRDYLRELEGRVCIISQKQNQIVSRLLEEKEIDEEQWIWFGALRGIDRFNGWEHLVVLGDPSLPIDAYELEKHRMGISQHKEIMTFGEGYSDPEGYYTRNRGTLMPVEGDKYSEWIHHRKILSELGQAIGRVRPLSCRATIHLLSAFAPADRDICTYRVDSRLVTASSAVTDHRENLFLKWMLESGDFTVAQISAETGYDPHWIHSLQKTKLKEARIRKATHLSEMGHSPAEIAKILNSSVRTIYRWLEKKS